MQIRDFKHSETKIKKMIRGLPKATKQNQALSCVLQKYRPQFYDNENCTRTLAKMRLSTDPSVLALCDEMDKKLEIYQKVYESMPNPPPFTSNCIAYWKHELMIPNSQFQLHPDTVSRALSGDTTTSRDTLRIMTDRIQEAFKLTEFTEEDIPRFCTGHGGQRVPIVEKNAEITLTEIDGCCYVVDSNITKLFKYDRVFQVNGGQTKTRREVLAALNQVKKGDETIWLSVDRPQSSNAKVLMKKLFSQNSQRSPDNVTTEVNRTSPRGKK